MLFAARVLVNISEAVASRTRHYVFASLGNNSCYMATLELLNANPDSRDQVLSLLGQYRHLSKGESDGIMEAAIRHLSDESGSVRIQASITLAELANPSAISYLQSAIANEPDDAVRSQMQHSLDLLEERRP